VSRLHRVQITINYYTGDTRDYALFIRLNYAVLMRARWNGRSRRSREPAAHTNWCFNMRLRVIGLDCNNNAILHDNAYAANI